MKPAERFWYDTGYRTAKKQTIDTVLQIIDAAQTFKMNPGEDDTYIDKMDLKASVLAIMGNTMKDGYEE